MIKSSMDGGGKRPSEAPGHSFIRATAASEYVSGYVNELQKKNIDQTLLGKRKVDTAIRSLSKKLDAIPVIRVGLTEAPGQGDHTAAFSIIEGLARLGFKGRVELVLKSDDDNEWVQMKEKLQLFIPEFNLDNDEVQALHYSGLECECIPLKHLEDHCRINHRPLEQPLGFWAMNANRSWLQSKIAIVIPPFQWANTKPRIERKDRGHQNLEFPSLANYQILCTPKKPDLSKLMKGDSRGPRLEKVLRDTEEGRIHLLPVYGIHHQALEPAHDVIIKRLLSGAIKSHTSAFEKTVVLILSPLESLERLQALQASLEVPFYNLNNTDWVSSPNETAVLQYCGPVPKPVFEWISCLDRPLVQEGANSAAFMSLQGKTYLPLRPDGDTPLPEVITSPPAKKKSAAPTHDSVVIAERVKIEQLGRSLTHDLQAYSYYSVAQDLFRKLRPLLSPMAIKDLASKFEGMVGANHFDEADFRPLLVDSITYSREGLSEEQKEWLKCLVKANSFYPGAIPTELKSQLIEGGKALRKKRVSLEKLIAYRTSGLNMPYLRLQLSALSLRRFEVLKGITLEHPVIFTDTAHNMDVNELAGDICDNFALLIPALFQILRQDFSDDALMASFFEAGEGKQSLLDKIIGHLFHENMAHDSEIRSLLEPKESDIDELALFLRGEFGGAYSKQVFELMMEPKNNAVYCGLTRLTRRDWNQILPR
ncbi:hypothetical protein [Endozoicomonas atrinae]|uniref:hypothetical protein n=1 Tax=Endozoicomonas atrinae TaxID=1333660 RepID=UPI003B00A599